MSMRIIARDGHLIFILYVVSGQKCVTFFNVKILRKGGAGRS